MLRTLLFLRHGIASERTEWQGTDHDRPLTPAGIEAMQRQAQAMLNMKLGIGLIMTSPLVRAQQTAQIVATALGVPVMNADQLAPGFDQKRLSVLIADYKREAPLLLVGHEPDLSDVISRLIGGNGSLKMEKGSLANVKLSKSEPFYGQLQWLLTPELMGA